MFLALTLCLLPSLALCGLAPTYFGFWGPDAPSEMSTFSNLAFANTATEAVANSVHGIHSLLKLQDVFVNQTVRWHYRLNDDYAARWATLAPQVPPCQQPAGHLQCLIPHGVHASLHRECSHTCPSLRSRLYTSPSHSLAQPCTLSQLAPLVANGSALGFFLGDELLWNGMAFAEMETYADAVRAVYPRTAGSGEGVSVRRDAVIYTNAAWPTLFPTIPGEPTSPGDIGAVPDAQLWLRVPASLDWWGVDVYPDQFSQAGALTVLHANVLRKFKSAAQRLVVIPPFYGDRPASTTDDRRQLDCGASDCDDAMLRWAVQFTRTFLNASYKDATRVVAAMPYHWQSLGDGAGMRAQGGKELPRARAAWVKVGRAIVAAERRIEAD
jgi:hypothetical protein